MRVRVVIPVLLCSVCLTSSLCLHARYSEIFLPAFDSESSILPSLQEVIVFIALPSNEVSSCPRLCAPQFAHMFNQRVPIAYATTDFVCILGLFRPRNRITHRRAYQYLPWAQWQQRWVRAQTFRRSAKTGNSRRSCQCNRSESDVHGSQFGVATAGDLRVSSVAASCVGMYFPQRWISRAIDYGYIWIAGWLLRLNEPCLNEQTDSSSKFAIARWFYLQIMVIRAKTVWIWRFANACAISSHRDHLINSKFSALLKLLGLQKCSDVAKSISESDKRTWERALQGTRWQVKCILSQQPGMIRQENSVKEWIIKITEKQTK